jgi:hypothetical protein
MEFLKASFIDTTTAIVVNSNTATGANILSRDLTFQYQSSGFNNDSTTTTIRINFSETLTVSRLALMGTNVKSMTWFYNGATANTFAFSTTAATTTSNFSANSETSMFFQCTPVNCTSVSFDLKSTMVANSEKAVGYIYVGQEHIDFPLIPSAKDYKPSIDTKDITHELSSGKTRIQVIDTVHAAQIKLTHISTSFRDSLREVYNLHSNFVFVAFGTSTGWDEFLFPCVWDGPFDFLTYADNFSQAGFTGTIRLRETAP